MRMSALLLVLIAIPVASTATPQRKTSRQPSPPSVVRLTEVELIASALRKVEPSYPRVASAARVSGSVPVEIAFDEDGNTMMTKSLSGHPLLKDCATQAARGWKYKPAMLHGRPVKGTGIITFNFDWRCESVSFGPSPASLEIPCEYPSKLIILADRADVDSRVERRQVFLPEFRGGSFVMPPPYWLTARVVDNRTGLPVPGAIVQLADGHRSGWGSVTTNERGEFTFYNVAATRIDLKGNGGKHIEVLLFRWPGTGFLPSRYTSRSKTLTVADMNGKGIPGAGTITLRVVREPSVSGVRAR